MRAVPTYYVSRENRDAEYHSRKRAGLDVRRRSIRGVILNPLSVRDYTGPTSSNGYGGCEPQLFGTLYVLDTRD